MLFISGVSEDAGSGDAARRICSGVISLEAVGTEGLCVVGRCPEPVRGCCWNSPEMVGAEGLFVVRGGPEPVGGGCGLSPEGASGVITATCLGLYSCRTFVDGGLIFCSLRPQLRIMDMTHGF